MHDSARLLQAQRAGAVGTICNGCEVEGGCSGTVEYNRCRSETIERCRQVRQARWQSNLLRVKQVQRHRLPMQELRSIVFRSAGIPTGGSLVVVVDGDYKNVAVDNDAATANSGGSAVASGYCCGYRGSCSGYRYDDRGDSRYRCY